jgi:hypothetical protein
MKNLLYVFSHNAYYHEQGPYNMLSIALKMVPDIGNYTQHA